MTSSSCVWKLTAPGTGSPKKFRKGKLDKIITENKSRENAHGFSFFVFCNFSPDCIIIWPQLEPSLSNAQGYGSSPLKPFPGPFSMHKSRAAPQGPWAQGQANSWPRTRTGPKIIGKLNFRNNSFFDVLVDRRWSKDARNRFFPQCRPRCFSKTWHFPANFYCGFFIECAQTAESPPPRIDPGCF